MKTKTRFTKIYHKLPEKMRYAVWEPYGSKPRTLLNCFYEIKHDTKLGKELLKEMGF